jgi:hypothetical protein
MPQHQIDSNANWILQFIATSELYMNTGFPSNGFVVQQGSMVSTTTIATSTSSSATTPSNTQNLVPPPTSGSSRLSTGPKAAIGVVIFFVILALVGGLLYMFWRKRRVDGKGKIVYMDGLEMDKSGALPPAYPVEMPETGQRVELGDGGRHELK